jgi:tripartite-type tricarboxylate transporter receptor subunit TctC
LTLDSAGPLTEDRGREDTTMRSKLYAAAISLLALVVLPLFAQAQVSFPTKTVKFIVPFPAGGINDVLARIVADKLQPKWGHPVIIEQKVGAGGNLGAELAALAEPDGYTILVAPPGPLSINHMLYKKLTYNPEAFVPITVLGGVPNVAFVKKELPVNSLTELVEYAKKNPGKLIYGSQGVGATPHLTANMFMGMTGTQMVHVPYRGETLVYQDMLGGHVDLFFGNVSGGLGLWRDGKIKALAVLDKKRPSQIPSVPTVAEAGMPALISTTWFAVVGPPKLPPALQQQIAAAFVEVLKMSDVQEKFRNVGIEPVGGTTAETAAFLKDETRRWGEVIRKNNIVID